jgi:hypothetical protein
MRRRVSREQLLDASQSILSPRGNLRCKGGGMPNGYAPPTVAYRAKGKPAKIPVPGSGTDSPLGCGPQVGGLCPFCQVRRGNATGHGDAGGGLGKSFLFSRSGRGPGNLLEGERVLAFCEERRQHGAASGELPPGP